LVSGADVGFCRRGGGVGGEAGADQVFESGDGSLVRGQDVEVEVGQRGAEADGEMQWGRAEERARR
jgi:hypothetical protein